MKRTVLLATLCLLLGLVNTSLAVEVILHEKTYVRTDGDQNQWTAMFPSSVDEARLVVKNGNAEGESRVNSTDQVSSAIIMVNGVQILGPKDFNQNVYEIEAPLFNLGKENSISVELRSKPGSYITVQVIGYLDADAGAVIGTPGGIVEVTDPNSPIYGARVEIPEGALDNSVVISISLAENQDLEGDTNTVYLNPSGLVFNKPVILTLPLLESNNDLEPFVLVTYDEETGEYIPTFDIIYLNEGENFISSAILHFSKWNFKKAWKYFNKLSQETIVRMFVGVNYFLNNSADGIFEAIKTYNEWCDEFCKFYAGFAWAAMSSGKGTFPDIPNDCLAEEPNDIESCTSADEILTDMLSHLHSFLKGYFLEYCLDEDEDGYYPKIECGTFVDCDDSNPNIHPYAEEECNGIDDDCDTEIDEECGNDDKIFNPDNGHYYQRIDFGQTWPNINWHEARAYCENLGGYLVSITSLEENNFIFNNVVLHNVTYFIGATDEVVEGTWQWVSGEPWDYDNWDNCESAPGLDDSTKGGREDYATFYANHTGGWGDIEDSTVGPFICEWDN